MVVCSLVAVFAFRSCPISSEFYSVRVNAGADFQRMDAPRCSTARGLELDVARANWLLLPDSSRRGSQRCLPDRLRTRHDGFRPSGLARPTLEPRPSTHL